LNTMQKGDASTKLLHRRGTRIYVDIQEAQLGTTRKCVARKFSRKQTLYRTGHNLMSKEKRHTENCKAGRLGVQKNKCTKSTKSGWGRGASYYFKKRRGSNKKGSPGKKLLKGEGGSSTLIKKKPKKTLRCQITTNFTVSSFRARANDLEGEVSLGLVGGVLRNWGKRGKPKRGGKKNVIRPAEKKGKTYNTTLKNRLGGGKKTGKIRKLQVP